MVTNYLFGTKEEAKPENEDPDVALREALDAHGEFAMNEDGVLKWDDCVVLHKTIVRQAMRSWNNEGRVDHETKKRDAFKAKDNNTAYVQAYIEAQHAYQERINVYAKKACEYLEIELQVYNESVQAGLTVEGEETGKKRLSDLLQSDNVTKLALNNVRNPVTMDKETFKKCLKKKMQLDLGLKERIQEIAQQRAQQEVQGIHNVESSKIGEQLYDEFGIDINHLEQGIEHYKLAEDEDIKKFKDLILLQMKTNQEKMIAQCTMPPEMQAELIQEADELGKPAIKADQTLTFDYYLDSQKIIRKYLTRFMEPMIVEQATKRRALLKTHEGAENDYNNAFEKAVAESTHLNESCEHFANSIFYEHVKVEREVFVKTH